MSRLERVLSGNVNIGIGIMLESLFDIKDRYDNKRVIPKKIDIEKYDYHFYNIITFIRNITQSIKNSDYTTTDVTNILIDELNYINSTYYSNIKTEMILFIPDYKELILEYNKDKEYSITKHDEDIAEVMEYVKSLTNEKLKGLEVKIVRQGKKEVIHKNILLTTSYLLDIAMIGMHDWLESHTGILKNKHKLNSKYATIGKRDLNHLPYNKTLHKVLGDKTFIKPFKIGTRVEIYNISISKKWNTLTSEDKVKQDIKHLLK